MRSIYSLINLSGLVVGLSAFILIFLWIEEEWSYDRFHQDNAHIYRVVENQFNDNNEVYPVAVTPAPLAPYLKSTFAEVAFACRVGNSEFSVRRDETAFVQKGILADPEFFDVFTFPVERGELKTFAGGIDVVMISERLAGVYFNSEDPVGKTLTILGKELQVAAVFKNVPGNSHLQFDFVIPMEFVRSGGYDDLQKWNINGYYTYARLSAQADPAAFADKIRNVIKAHHPKTETDILLQPLRAIHLHSGHLNNDSGSRGNMMYVYIFSVVGIFILIIASINYANLATARSLKRAKEAGVRKVIGANRLQLMLHFFSESFLYSVLAFLVAVAVSWFMLPSFNALSGKLIAFEIFNPTIYLPLLASVIFCSFLGGAYPALLLSALNPAIVLKGYLKNGKGTIIFRRTLVVLQFVLAISFLAGTLVVQDQLEYIRARDLGFEKENILTFTANRNLRKQFNAFKAEVLALPGVLNVTATSSRLSNINESSDMVEWEGKNTSASVLFHVLPVEHDFVKTFSMEIVAGRDFSPEIISDSGAMIVNEEAVKQMGITDPLGKTISLGSRVRNPIIGVVKDFNFKSAHKKIEPMLIFIDPDEYYRVAVRLGAGNLVEHTEAVKGVFKKISPGAPFEYMFLDEEIDQSYRNEERTSQVFSYLSALSVFISCLGLLGMVMFITEQRAREVALRKVLGASAWHLTWLLTREFILLVLVAFLIAAPAMYYLGNKWLDNFAYRVEAEIIVFVLAGIISLGVAALTVGLRSFKVALANPVDSLRSE
ncbi:MAG: ABC transporter permease [Cyclobacteriaceae bacterium]|nr:ABC transporter permease [Cyclobacteriaceae bacterium]